MKKTLSSLILALLSVGVFAAQRSVNEAAAIAAGVNNPTVHKIATRLASATPQSQTPSVRLVRTQKQPMSDKAAFYVFDREDQGFVIVSADDNTRDILAYSNQGSFPEQVPANVQFLLDYMAERIAYTSQIGKAATSTASYTPVAPLLDGIQWNQSEPYWNKCPIDKNGDRAYTGCVATATAQVMRYWQWPTKGTGSHSYTAENVSGTLSANFGTTTYDWANMPKTTSGYTTTTQKNAVATLMYHVGVAVEMDYGGKTIGGSGAYTSSVATALVNYFGYKNTLEFVDTYDWYYGRQVESASTTAQRMREDLAKGHPIVVGGSSEGASSGHEFVFEGYDKDGLFYVNWGWDGSYNGYYAIDDLEPGGSGIGGNGAGYSHFLDYVIGIEPNGSVTPPTPSNPNTISGLQYGDAYYLTNGGSPLWYIDAYKGYNNGYIYPRLYFAFYAKSKTSLSGTYNLLYVKYTTTTGSVIECYNGNVKISFGKDGKHHLVGSFYGDDGKAYAFDQTITINAYDNDNNNAKITLVESTWGEWEDFTPFDFNTGSFTFSAVVTSTVMQKDIPVQVREDANGNKQFKFIGWGKEVLTQDGIDLLVNMAPDYTCTVPEQSTGYYHSNYGEYIMVQDYASKTGEEVLSTYNPQTGVFKLALTYYISQGFFGSAYETMAMDKIITERDTVDVEIIGLRIEDLTEEYDEFVYIAGNENYQIELWAYTSTPDGTFTLSNGKLDTYSSITTQEGKANVQDGEVTVVINEKDTSLIGWVICDDEKYYRLNLSNPAGQENIPTVATLSFAGYDVVNKYVIAIHPDEEVCNPIVWAGTYNEWATTPNDMLHFQPLTDFDGWFVVEVDDVSETMQGKPVQLKKDGSFSWDFQSGDINAWINAGQPGTQTAIVSAGYGDEANLTWPTKGAYIYELAYWKKHNTPCIDVPKHNYTIKLWNPLCTDAEGNYFSPAIIGGFNNWATGIPMVLNEQEGCYVYVLENTEEGTEFKFREVADSDWLNQIQELTEEGWKDLPNNACPVVTQDTTLIFDYSDVTRYRYSLCSESATTDMEESKAAKTASKFIMNGQLYIKTDNGIFNVLGAIVK